MDTLLQTISKSDLQAFEANVAELFASGQIRGPIHLSGGNEDQLIKIFEDVKREDWVFSTWRSHYHAILHGVPRDEVLKQILANRSMNIQSPAHRFYTSAIVGGILPIAVGVAAAIKRQRARRHVWCFVGDMAASLGLFQDADNMARDLPITFVVEDNGVSANTPTAACWGYEVQTNTYYEQLPSHSGRVIRYRYERTYPHTGTDKWVQF